MINSSLNPAGADMDVGFYMVRVCPAYSPLDLSCLKIMGWSKLFQSPWEYPHCWQELKLFLFFSREVEARDRNLAVSIGTQRKGTVRAASLGVFNS